MKNVVKCYRCGKEIKLNPKSLSIAISCPHCHGKMVLNQKYKRYLKYLRYFVVLIACLFIMFGLKYVKTNLFISFMTLSLSLALAMVVDRLCLYLEYIIIGLKYNEERR